MIGKIVCNSHAPEEIYDKQSLNWISLEILCVSDLQPCLFRGIKGKYEKEYEVLITRAMKV